MTKKTIAIDPGHGGTDPGALGHDMTRESTLALRVGRELAIELTRLDMCAVMTRTDDTYPTLSDRAAKANTEKADAFVSVHLNASANTAALGPWVIHAKGSKRGRQLARAIYHALAPDDEDRHVHSDASPATDDRRLAVLRETSMPAVIVECGFISNPVELAVMKAEGWPVSMAVKIASGIATWFQWEEEESAA